MGNKSLNIKSFSSKSSSLGVTFSSINLSPLTYFHPLTSLTLSPRTLSQKHTGLRTGLPLSVGWGRGHLATGLLHTAQAEEGRGKESKAALGSCPLEGPGV